MNSAVDATTMEGDGLRMERECNLTGYLQGWVWPGLRALQDEHGPRSGVAAAGQGADAMLTESQTRAGSSCSTWPRTSVPPVSWTTRSASRSGTSTNAKRSSTRTLRTDSPSSWVAAVIAWMMSDGSSPAVRPPETISLRDGPSPLVETCGLEWRRGGALTGVSATW